MVASPGTWLPGELALRGRGPRGARLRWERQCLVEKAGGKHARGETSGMGIRSQSLAEFWSGALRPSRHLPGARLSPGTKELCRWQSGNRRRKREV